MNNKVKISWQSWERRSEKHSTTKVRAVQGSFVFGFLRHRFYSFFSLFFANCERMEAGDDTAERKKVIMKDLFGASSEEDEGYTFFSFLIAKRVNER